jgi:DNA-binding CsgD family transcriptional regulator
VLGECIDVNSRQQLAFPADALVGRERELQSLRAWLEAARHSRGRLILCAGEPGIGKTRLAQELAGVALAEGAAVAWGRCVEADGAPVYWPWRQVLRSLDVDAEDVLIGEVESPEERFRVFDGSTKVLVRVAEPHGLVVVLDDIHWADEPSLLLLRHIADRVHETRVLLVAVLRDVEPSPALRRLLPELLRSPAVERLDLFGFDLANVRTQLARAAGEASAEGRALEVLEATGGNPFFVREVARAIADGVWRADHPPRTVLDVVAARLDRLSPQCRRLLEVAAVIGRDVRLPLVAAVLGRPAEACLPEAAEAVAYGLLDRVGDGADYRFVHALTRDSVVGALSDADRIALHRAVALAIESHYARDLADHLSELARHWSEVAPFGEGPTARRWAIRAAEEAVRRLAFEEGVRLYRAALSTDAGSLDTAELCQLNIALGRAAYFAGDLPGCVDAAVAAAAAARAARSSELLAEAALVLEVAPDPRVHAVARELCDEALAELGETGTDAALRARLLAQRSHLAFYEGDAAATESLSGVALEVARASGEDRALVEALRARQEALPGPAGRNARLELAADMLAAGRRLPSPRAQMWGRLWRIEALVESGRLTAAGEELPALEQAVDRVGGPVVAWHLDRVTACVAQAQGRYDEAAAVARRGYELMRHIEPSPATGAYFALLTSLGQHVGMPAEGVALARAELQSPPRFVTLGRLTRALVLLGAGLTDEAAASFQKAGPVSDWSLPVFFVVPGLATGVLVAAGLGRRDDLAALLTRLEQFRGEHVAAGAVSYMGPVELTLGRGAAALGRLDDAAADLAVAVERADGAGAPGFVAAAKHHLARVLVERDAPGDRAVAELAARESDQLIRALGMAAYAAPSAALLAYLQRGVQTTALSARELEVAELVAEGLTNRQIAQRLFISERTAQNHVQHILVKLGFSSRSQVASWSVRRIR